MQINQIRVGVGARILFVTSLIVAVFTISNVYTYFQISVMQSRYVELITQKEPILNEVKNIRNEVWVQNSAATAYIVSWDMIYMQKFRASKEVSSEIFDSLEKKLSGKSLEELKDIKQSVGDFTKTLEAGMNVRNTLGINETMKSMAAAAGKISAIEESMEQFSAVITADMEEQIANTASSIDNMKRLILVINILTFILAAGFSIWLAKYIARSLSRVVGIMQRTAQGDLRQQDISYTSNDEIGDLIQAANAMVANLQKVIKQVINAAHQLASASEQLNISIGQSVQASEQVENNINEVAGGSVHQTASVDNTVVIVGNMAKAITHIADNAAQVSAKSEVAAHSALSGADAVSKATKQMVTIKDAVSKSSEVVHKLGNSSAQIGEIVDVISGIAGQTNLLALNAAIEAARAGAHGRGFAVVADEVRKLAEESNKSARKIAEIIAEIQKETSVVIETMNQGNTEASSGIAIIDETGQQFQAIVSLVSELNGQIQEISSAAGNLSLSSDEVVESVDHVKRIANHTADNTSAISASVERQSISMQEIALASQALGRMAEELNEAVQSFKI
jgi:methyl-accepting chemotaxis protein